MTDDVQIIKDKLNIVEYIKPLVMLMPAGKNLRGLCPFHKEKTPSFMVSPDRQIWHCFGGCNEGGDIFSFVMKYENIEFYEALRLLAEKAGIELSRSGGADYHKYHILYDINIAAIAFFADTLAHDPAVQQYVRERGLSPETVAEFGIGLAPAGSDALLRHLTQKGFAIEHIERAGLIFRTERGTYWDRFRNRLMFPLHNALGKPVGFTGRILPTAETHASISGIVQAKYVNSPETPIFQKSKFLYGFHKSKQHIRDQKSAILVEGQMDFLMSWQDGVKNVAATSGTALTTDHLSLLRRVTDELVLSFDNDPAGQMAIERSIDLAAASDFSVKVLVIPGGKDPADVVRSQPGLMAQLVYQTEPAMHFYFRRYPVLGVADMRQKKNNVRAILTKAKAMASPVERATWVKELAAMTGVDERVLLEEMQLLSVASTTDRMVAPQSKTVADTIPRKDRIAQRLLAIAYHEPTFAKSILSVKDFFPAAYHGALQYFTEPTKLNDSDKKYIDLISLLPIGNKVEFAELVRQLKIEFYKHRQHALGLVISRAERASDQVTVEKIKKEFDKITQERHNITNEKAPAQTPSEGQQEDQEAEEFF